MKKLVISLAMALLLWGCNEPETLLINSVSRDGSVKRKIVFTTAKDSLDFSAIRVPADTSWECVREVVYDDNEEGEIDTLFVFTLNKSFKSTDEINALYIKGGDKNSGLNRRSEFKRSFRWFTTRIIFREVVDPVLEGFPASDYFTAEELKLFYMPEELIEKAREGVDSTYYNNLQDSLDSKYDSWVEESLLNQWIIIIDSLAVEAGKSSPGPLLRGKLSQLADSLVSGDGDEMEKLESIMGKDFIAGYSSETDSSLVLIESILETVYSAGSYSVGLEMPGRLISTNGYQVEETGLRWFVKDDYYLCEPYVMWAESVVPNRWAWIVTAGFMLFVLSGFVSKFLRKR